MSPSDNGLQYTTLVKGSSKPSHFAVYQALLKPLVDLNTSMQCRAIEAFASMDPAVSQRLKMRMWVITLSFMLMGVPIGPT